MATIVQQANPQPSHAEHPKLRSSCDACGVAKVKCDRKTECGRCKTMSLECVYGPSRKFGKPPRKRLRTEISMPHANQQSIGSTTRPNGPNGANEINGTNEITGTNTSTFLDFPHASSTGARHILPATSFSAADQTGSTFLNTMPLDSINWDDFDSLQNSLGNSLLEGLSIPYGSTPANVGSTGNLPHDCTREAHCILGTLAFPHSLPGVNQEEIVAHLDHVLQNNKNAVDRLKPLFECSCSRYPHLAMLYASIITKILNCYEKAAGLSTCLNEDWHPPRCPGGEFEASSTNTSTTTPQANHPTNPPLVLGMFNIEEPCLQFIIKMQLIFGELKRITSLIDRFASMGANDSITSEAETLYASLGTWLKAERLRVIKPLWYKIRKMNESLTSLDI